MTTLLADRLSTAAAKVAKHARPPLQAVVLVKDQRRSEIGGTYLMNPGGFDIFVHGKLWGRTETEHCGPNGNRYYICQMLAGISRRRCSTQVARVGGPSRWGDSRTVYYVVRSDKMYLHNLKPGETPKPLQDRIIERVLEAIEAGALRDPAVIAAEAKREADKARAKEARAAQQSDAVWNAKAAECLGPLRHGIPAAIRAQIVAAIIDAMKWAQTQ